MTNHQSKFPTFAEVKAAALRSIERVLAHWLPGGKLVDGKREYTAPNPTRADKSAGSLKVNMRKGTWADFATHDKGGDLIDLVRYLDGGSETEACNRLAAFLGVMPGSTPAPAAARADTSSPAASASQPVPEWLPVLPIPADAMAKIHKSHPSHGTPSKVWIYRDAAGQPLMVLYRFDQVAADGERSKVFSPLTWCRPGSGKGAARWRWAGLPAPRPLLRLDRLAQQPAAPVVLCEGEKSADAAAELLPTHVATCWPNGSKSWQLADFTPLAGHDVLLWPDNDPAGQACMMAIADHLQQIGAASVRWVALDAFQRLPVLVEGLADFAEGGQWGDGDDAADALARGWTAGHLAALQQSGELYAEPPQPAQLPAAEPAPAPALPAEPAPAAATTTRKATKGKTGTKGTGTSPRQPRASSGETRPDSFRVTDAGVFYHGEDGAPRPVCSRLDILARTRDERGRGWGLLVEFDDPDGEKKRLNIPASAMAGEFGREVVGPLVDLGLRLAQGRNARNCRNDLQSYLQAYDSPERARLVNRLGWHGHAYLLPDRVLGDCGERLHFYDAGAILPAIEQAGTLEQWQQGVARYAVGNARLAFAVSVAFAAPLLQLLGAESGGFHLYGDSSGGKTTHLRAAVSVCGSPRMLCTWRSTGNALESTAAAHCDGLLALDEIHQCDAREIGDVVYMLGNGEGKARANDRGVMAKRSLQWRLLFLSTGERTLAQHMAEAGKELKAGMEVRMIGIPTDNGDGLGLFDDLHGFPGGGELAEAINANAAKWYGTPLAAFLEELTQPNQLVAFRQLVRGFMDKFPAKVLPPDASGQARRVALRFGLVAAAGELASGMGVTGWPDGTATAGARACFAAWLAARGGVGNLEDEKIIAHLRALIELHGESRFTRWDRTDATIDEHAPRTANRLGFRRTAEYSTGLPDGRSVGVLFYVLGAVWASEIWKGYNVATVNRVLLDRGILEPCPKGGPSRSERLPTMGKTRCYVVKPEALFSDAPADAAAAA